MTKTTTHTNQMSAVRLGLAIVTVFSCALITGCGGKSEDATKPPPVSANAKADAPATGPGPAKAQNTADVVK